MPESRILSGRHAVVTGGGRGIGAAVADELGRLGARVTVMGRDRPTLDARAEAVAARHGVDTAAVPCDVTSASSVAEAFRIARETFGAPYALVANAGQAAGALTHETTLDLWEQMLAVNLTGTFLCIRAVLPAMREAKAGRIVCVSSSSALRGFSRMSAYAAAKAGVHGLVRSVAAENAKLGITVNAVAPGYTDTAMARAAEQAVAKGRGVALEEARAMIERTNPRGTYIQPEEVAALVGWLCSPEAAAVSGQAIAVAGGEVS